MEGLRGAQFIWLGRAIGGDDDKREKKVRGEGGDGKDEKGKSADAGCGFPSLIDFFGSEVRICCEDGVHVELTDVSRNVEKEREPWTTVNDIVLIPKKRNGNQPAHPVEKLDFADLPDLGWKTPQRSENLAEEGDDADSRCRWRTFETRVSFPDVKAGEQDCAAKSKGSNDTQNLELRVTKNASGKLFKIRIAGKVSEDISKTCDPASPSVGVFLLMGWRIVYDEGSDACLDYESVSYTLCDKERSSYTCVDGKIKDIDESNCKNNGRNLDSVRCRICTEYAQGTVNNLARPGEKQKRKCSSSRTCQHEWLPLAPWYAAIITPNANIRLDECARYRSRYPYKSQQGFTHTK